MKIFERKICKPKTVVEIGYGEVFKVGDETYQKLRLDTGELSVKEGSGVKILVSNLSTGNAILFKPDVIVRPYQSELILTPLTPSTPFDGGGPLQGICHGN